MDLGTAAVRAAPRVQAGRLCLLAARHVANGSQKHHLLRLPEPSPAPARAAQAGLSLQPPWGASPASQPLGGTSARLRVGFAVARVPGKLF